MPVTLSEKLVYLAEDLVLIKGDFPGQDPQGARKALLQEGCRFKTRSDSETIIHAYAVYGEHFVDRLHGMFAFALLDRRSERLFLARDARRSL